PRHQRPADEERGVAPAVAGLVAIALEEIAIEGHRVVRPFAGCDAGSQVGDQKTVGVTRGEVIKDPALIDEGNSLLRGKCRCVKATQTFETPLDMDNLATVLRRLLEQMGVGEVPPGAGRQGPRGDGARLDEQINISPDLVGILLQAPYRGAVFYP